MAALCHCDASAYFIKSLPMRGHAQTSGGGERLAAVGGWLRRFRLGLQTRSSAGEHPAQGRQQLLALELVPGAAGGSTPLP